MEDRFPIWSEFIWHVQCRYGIIIRKQFGYFNWLAKSASFSCGKYYCIYITCTVFLKQNDLKKSQDYRVWGGVLTCLPSPFRSVPEVSVERLKGRALLTFTVPVLPWNGPLGVRCCSSNFISVVIWQ